jgi:hypothetical protein
LRIETGTGENLMLYSFGLKNWITKNMEKIV